jgi:hypothetical protein
MTADLKRERNFFLFKTKIQPANSNSGQRGDAWYSTEVDGRIHIENAKITDLVEDTNKQKKKSE